MNERRWALAMEASSRPDGYRLLARWAVGCAQDVLYLIPEEDVRAEAADALAMAVAYAEGRSTLMHCRHARDTVTAIFTRYVERLADDVRTDALCDTLAAVVYAASAVDAHMTAVVAGRAVPHFAEQHLRNLTDMLEIS